VAEALFVRVTSPEEMDRDSEAGGDEDPTGRNGVDDDVPGGRIDRRTVLGAAAGAGSTAVA